MECVKLKPAIKDYIWGGEKLKEWGKKAPGIIAECWELSFHPDGPSVIASGANAGKLLSDVATAADIGEAAAKFPGFPVLVKLIDAKQNLSVQVHPSDDYALKFEGGYGKTEMWYVADCQKGAGLYVGFTEKIGKEEFVRRIQNGTLTDVLKFFEVKKGDSFFIEAGTVHAIGAGVTVAEVQQSSNLTYRIYDYGRVGTDGKPRQLHVDKALAVAKTEPYTKPEFPEGVLADCEYFTAESFVSNGAEIGRDDSFVSLTVTEGHGIVNGAEAGRGDTFFVPAGKRAQTSGNLTGILTYVKGE